MIRFRKLFCIFVILSIVSFAFPSFPAAHAFIIKSAPFENQILLKSPKKVILHFDEDIQTSFLTVKVLDMNGKQVDRGNSHINPKNSLIAECGLIPHLQNGTYRIEWKAISDDGHPVEGVIPFGIGQVNVEQSSFKVKSTGAFPPIDLVVLRWIQFVSGAFYVGLLFFRTYVIIPNLNPMLDNRYKKFISYSFSLLCLTIVVNLPLQAAFEADVSWKEVFDFSIIRDFLKNSFYGKIWAIQMVIVTLLMIPTSFIVKNMITKRRIWHFAFFLSCILLLTKAFTSHSVSSNFPLIAIVFDFLHLLAAFLWTGSLAAMVILLPMTKNGESNEHYKIMIRSFSGWGILAVLVLTITGLFAGFSNITTLDSLFATNYGRVLLTKVSLFIIMLLFAFNNFSKGKSNKEGRWGFSFAGELATGILVLFFAVLLTNLPTAASTPNPFMDTRYLDKGEQVTLKIDPGIAGINHFEVMIKDHSGKASNTIQQVTLTFVPYDEKMGKEKVILPQVSKGRFYSQGMNINGVGHWKINVHVLKRDFTTTDLNYSFTVGKQ